MKFNQLIESDDELKALQAEMLDATKRFAKLLEVPAPHGEPRVGVVQTVRVQIPSNLKSLIRQAEMRWRWFVNKQNQPLCKVEWLYGHPGANQVQAFEIGQFRKDDVNGWVYRTDGAGWVALTA